MTSTSNRKHFSIDLAKKAKTMNFEYANYPNNMTFKTFMDPLGVLTMYEVISKAFPQTNLDQCPPAPKWNWRK